MKSLHPFDGQALWIWSSEGIHHAPEEGSPSHYQVRRFRRTFQVDHPEQAQLQLHCSADSRYKLFCNGRMVGRGPAKGDVLHQFYETYDLTSYLLPGRNVLAALVMDYSPVKPYPPEQGAPTSIMTYAGSFIIEGSLETQSGEVLEPLSTDTRWKVQVDKAYRFHSKNELYGGFTGFYEHFIGALEPQGWTLPDFDDQAWEQACYVCEGFYLGHPFNFSNHYGLTPRLIPMLEEEKVERFAKVFLPGGASAGPDWTRWVNIDQPLTIPAHTQVTVILDAGQETTAFPMLSVAGGVGARVRILYAEGLRLPWSVTDARILGRAGGTANVKVGYADDTSGWTVDSRGAIDGFYDLFEPEGNEQTYEPFHWRTFRFIELAIETAAAPLELCSFKHRFTAYPWQPKAGFKCSDPRYDQFWDISWRTFQLCTHETFEDCPYYEQMQYAGDTQITSLIAMLTTGDDRLTRQAMLHFEWSRLPEGLTQSRYPSRFLQMIPSWSLHWIFMIADFLLYSGDREFAAQFVPGIQATLGWFRRQKNDQGLLSGLMYWNFTDWSPDWDRGVCQGSATGPTMIINAEYLHALKMALAIERETGGSAWCLAELEAEIKELTARINAAFWSEAEGLYFDQPGGPAISQYANAWAIHSGAADEEQCERMSQRFPQDPALSPASFFGQHFIFRALRKLGRYALVPELLAPWHLMAESGLTTWAEESTYWRSLCHAWSAAPMLEFISEVLGVQPLTPGFAKTRIAPQTLGLNWAEGSVATPQGPIHVRWELQENTFTIHIESPLGLEISVVAPDGKQHDFAGGTFEHRFQLELEADVSIV